MFPLCDCKLIFLINWISTAMTMSLLNSNSGVNDKTEVNLADFIFAKGYLPNDKDLPKPAIVKNVDNDVTYLLSKLSDEELIKVLSDQPSKNEYNVKDLVKITTNTKYSSSYNPTLNFGHSPKSKPISNANELIKNFKKKRFQTVSSKNEPQTAYFRLEHKQIDPFANKGEETQNAAIKKLNNLFYNRPAEAEIKVEDDDEKKELLFDILVAQLKTLCCKRNKPLKKTDEPKLKLKSLLSDIMPQEATPATTYASEIKSSVMTKPKEHMFLIVNDEIKSNKNEEDDLISVDPDSLGKNSSVMLLGPIISPLSDAQLKIVMMRISNELSKPEYLSLLQQISDGTLSNEHIGLLDSLVSGPQTRRYIKPHRCNEQSQMTRVYRGPKWIICTGYLNFNKPSLYD